MAADRQEQVEAEAKQIEQVNANKTHVWQNLTYPGRLNL